MKILNIIDKARKSLQVTPDKFLGKDVWVRCSMKSGYRNSATVGYVKINRKIGDNEFRGNFISDTELAKISELSEEEKFLLVTRECTIPARRLIIYEPVKLLPKRKLPEVSELSDKSPIDKFIGKDFWVKVQLTKNHVPQPAQYVRFLRKTGYYIECNCVYAGCVDYHSTLSSPIDSLLEDIHYVHVSGIILCEPIELYTTEELVEELQQCAEYDEDDDEYDDEDEYYEDEEEYDDDEDY